MNKFLKIITICLIIFLTGLFLYLIIDEVKKIFNLLIFNESYTFKDPTLFIPIMFIILSIPSLIFHLKTLKYYQKVQIDKIEIIDQNHTYTNRSKVKINRFLWVSNFLVAISIIIMGIVVLILMLENITLDDIEKSFRGYLILVTLLFIGIFMILDALKIKKLATTQG